MNGISPQNTSRTVWEVVYAPLSILLLVAACLLVGLFTGDLPFGVAGFLIVVAPPGWELWQAFKVKGFSHEDVAS